MKQVNELFFDEHSTLWDMISFYGTLLFMYTVGGSTIAICAPHLLKFLLACIIVIIAVLWIIAKKTKKRRRHQQRRRHTHTHYNIKQGVFKYVRNHMDQA